MFQINKLLTALFLIIFGATMIEIGLFLYYQFHAPARPTVIYASPTPSSVQPTPAPYGSYAYWATQKKAVLVGSTKTDDSEGSITDLDTKGGTLPLGKSNFPYSLKITVTAGKNEFTFIYDASDMKQLKIQDKSGAAIKPDGLKVGDKIHIKETVNLLSPKTNLLEVTIRKL